MKRTIIILSGCLLAGCAHFESQPLAPDKSAAQLESRRLEDAGLKLFLQTNSISKPTNWPLPQWDLDSLTLAAFYFHPSLQVARAQWREALAGIKTAAGRPNPTVTVGPGYDFSALSGVNPWLPFGSMDVPIETAGKRGKRMSQAGKRAEVARQNFFVAAWSVRANVRASLVEFIVARDRTVLVETQFTAQSEISRRQEQRLAAGDISRAEVNVSRIALGRLQLELGDAQARRAEARAQLAASIGVPARALDGVKLAFSLAASAPHDLTDAAARRLALCGRADVRAALADYAAAEAALRLEIAKQYPDLHLNPGYQFDQGEHKWTLGFTFELPLLNQNQGPIAEARAQREVAAAKFVARQAEIIGEIDRAVAQFRVANAQLKSSGDFYRAAEQQQQAVRAGLQAGATDHLDLLSGQIEFAAAALVRLEAETKWQTAIGALENALQRPTDSLAALDSSQP